MYFIFTSSVYYYIHSCFYVNHFYNFCYRDEKILDRQVDSPRLFDHDSLNIVMLSYLQMYVRGLYYHWKEVLEQLIDLNNISNVFNIFNI
jgi:hypothetical protein